MLFECGVGADDTMTALLYSKGEIWNTELETKSLDTITVYYIYLSDLGM